MFNSIRALPRHSSLALTSALLRFKSVLKLFPQGFPDGGHSSRRMVTLDFKQFLMPCCSMLVTRCWWYCREDARHSSNLAKSGIRRDDHQVCWTWGLIRYSPLVCIDPYILGFISEEPSEIHLIMLAPSRGVDELDRNSRLFLTVGHVVGYGICLHHSL